MNSHTNEYWHTFHILYKHLFKNSLYEIFESLGTSKVCYIYIIFMKNSKSISKK